MHCNVASGSLYEVLAKEGLEDWRIGGPNERLEMRRTG